MKLPEDDRDRLEQLSDLLASPVLHTSMRANVSLSAFLETLALRLDVCFVGLLMSGVSAHEIMLGEGARHVAVRVARYAVHRLESSRVSARCEGLSVHECHFGEGDGSVRLVVGAARAGYPRSDDKRAIEIAVRKISREATREVMYTDAHDGADAPNIAYEHAVQLRSIIDAIPTLVWSSQADGRADFFNQRWLEYTGLTFAAAQGLGWIAALHPHDVERIDACSRASIDEMDAYEVEARFRRFDGEYRWFLFRVNALRDAYGAITKWYGTNTDIHDRKIAEEAARRGEALLAQAQKIARLGSFLWKPDSSTMIWSDALYEIYEFEPAPSIDLDTIKLRLHPDDQKVHEQKVQSRKRMTNFENEVRLLMPDGAIKHLFYRARLVRNHDGDNEFVGVVQDVTDRVLAVEALTRAHAELAEVTRATSIATLTASIAHEVNQPLSGVVTNASTCLRMLSAQPPRVEAATEVARRLLRDGNRTADVIAKLRRLFERKEIANDPIDLTEAASEVLHLLSSELRANRILLRKELAASLPRVRGDRLQLQQVILNLLRNASDALGLIDDRPRHVVVKTRAEAGRVHVTIEDSGVGFDDTHSNLIFASFFSTKRDGMGIGLSVSRAIVEAHGGSLWAANNARYGATFGFSLPVVDDRERT